MFQVFGHCFALLVKFASDVIADLTYAEQPLFSLIELAAKTNASPKKKVQAKLNNSGQLSAPLADPTVNAPRKFSGFTGTTPRGHGCFLLLLFLFVTFVHLKIHNSSNIWGQFI